MEQVTAKVTLKDEDDKPLKDAEGKNQYDEVTIDYDFGDDLNQAVELCGEEVVFSQFVSAAKVSLQGIMRAKLKAGLGQDAIQSFCNEWKPGMVVAKTTVDPIQATMDAFATWSPEKREEYIRQLTSVAAE